ncbi:MAG: PDDEXK nuclease domain-containing protein [Pirellulaceae bacterium]
MTKKPAKQLTTDGDSPTVFDLECLAQSIQTAHEELARQASKAVNISLTVRNWLIGHYIAEFELNGADRALYGDKLLDRLATRLSELGVKTCEKRRLYQYLRFYNTYPEIVRSLTAQSQKLLLPGIQSTVLTKVRSAPALFGLKLIDSLSYTHLELLVALDDEAKRAFYETECVRGSWSVRDLKRQISSLLYERSQLSIDKHRLLDDLPVATEPSTQRLTIRDPYIFEFLGLTPLEVMSESHLEDQLLDKLQAFLLELGQGFCFEARQRRMLIGDKYYFVDLVFYHRILKCHVLVDLKLEEFTHENIGQLNTYVSWFDKHVREPGDNPPIGILLCTEKDYALVQYALAAMDNSLFVSKYQLQLPTPEVLKQQLEAERRRLEDELESSNEQQEKDLHE